MISLPGRSRPVPARRAPSTARHQVLRSEGELNSAAQHFCLASYASSISPIDWRCPSTTLSAFQMTEPALAAAVNSYTTTSSRHAGAATRSTHVDVPRQVPTSSAGLGSSGAAAMMQREASSTLTVATTTPGRTRRMWILIIGDLIMAECPRHGHQRYQSESRAAVLGAH